MPRSADARVAEILDDFRAAAVSAPYLMCDRHPEESIAFRIIDGDLTERTISYGQLAASSRRVARVLHEHGVRAGDRVAT
jgi:acetyl-CoA synthetase